MVSFLAGCFVGVVVTVFIIAICFAARENDAAAQMEMRGRCSVCGRVVGPGGRCPVGCGYQPDGQEEWIVSPSKIFNEFRREEGIDG